MFNAMKTMGAAFWLVLASTFPLAAQHAHAAHGNAADVDAIRDVVTTAYVKGIHGNGSREAIRRGFHPSFVMKVLTDGQVGDVTIEEWISRLPAEGTPARRVDHRFPAVHVAGDAAVAVVELDIEGRHTFTDYISLYRFPEGWRIVGKIFNRHGG